MTLGVGTETSFSLIVVRLICFQQRFVSVVTGAHIFDLTQTIER